jgi:metal iron transporter
VDVISSLLGFAVLINSFILVLASAVFFYGPAPADGSSNSGSPASLFDAHALISSRVGKGAGTLFAVSLLFAGQSAALIGTLAGQVVADGFVQWSAPPVLRRLIARAVSLVPGMVVAAVKGRDGVDALLVASQVVLAFVLPFVTLPLLLLTSSKEVMSVKKEVHAGGVVGEEGNVGEMISFANGRISQAFGWIVWVVLVVANVYVLVELGRGET